MIKVGIVGPESTGKSELAEKLALHYQCNWVKEYARGYLENLNREYTYDDLKEIAKGQIALEEKMHTRENDFLFCDTTLMVIKVWSNFKYNKTDHWILEKHDLLRYDFYLLCNIDLPWQPDPLREHPGKRKELMSIYLDEIKLTGTIYSIVSGSGDERLQNAIKAIEDHKKKRQLL